MSAIPSPEEKPAKAKPRAMLLVPLILVIGILGLMYVSLQTGEPSRLPSVLIGKPVPDFELAALPRLENELGAPGSWLLVGDAEKRQGQPFECLGLVVRAMRRRAPAACRAGQAGHSALRHELQGRHGGCGAPLPARQGNPFQAVGMDTTGMTAIDFGVYGVPETFVIDGSGHIVLRYPGPLTPEIIAEKIMPAIGKAEKEGAAAKS